MVLGTSLPVIAAALVLAVGATNGYWSRSVHEMQRATVPLHVANEIGCGRSLEDPRATEPDCAWNVDAEGAPIYLIGDSNAAHYSESFISIAETLDRPLETALASACPPFEVGLVYALRGPEWDERCANFATSTLEWLESSEPGLVVISTTSSYWSSPEMALTLDGEVVHDVSSRLQVLGETLTDATRRLRDSGHEVLLFASIPKFGWEPQSCGLAVIVAGQCDKTAALVDIARAQREAWEIIESVAAEEGAHFWLPADELCPDGVCSVLNQDGVVMYRDGGHLSIPGTKVLTPVLLELVRDAG